MKFKLIIDRESEEEVIVKSHSANDFVTKIENLVMSYAGNDEMIVHGDYELISVKYSDIECITVNERKLFVVYKDGKMYRASGKLCDIESSLPSYFIRINKSTIANERKITRYKTLFNGGVDAIFASGYKDYVSRRCFAEIKRRYNV